MSTTEEQEEQEIKNFMIKVSSQLNLLFPDVGFSLTIFDHFSNTVVAQATNSEEDLTEVYQQMIAFTQKTAKTFRSKTSSRA